MLKIERCIKKFIAFVTIIWPHPPNFVVIFFAITKIII